MPLPLLALAVPAVTAGARVAAPAVGKAVAQGAAKNAGKAAPKPPAPKPQPPKQNNPPKPKDDKKPEPKKEEKKPEPKKEEKKPEPMKNENKDKKPTRDREDREELTEQVLDTNRPGRGDDASSDGAKPAGPKPKNPVVAPKAPKAGDLLVSLAVKNNGQDWFWFVHHPTEANTGMTMHADGTITKGFTVKLARKTTVDKLKSAAGTKSVELIKLQWVEKRWWDEDMFGANKAAKAEAPFETTAFGVKPPTVTECAPVKESAAEMAKDRLAAQIKRKDDKTWILESCEALVRAGALNQNVLTFLEKLKDSYGVLGGKTPTGPHGSPANTGKQSGRTGGTPTKGKDGVPTRTPTKNDKPSTPNNKEVATPKKTLPGKLPATIPGLGAKVTATAAAVAANK
ncbi:hypothetical protein B0T21DRAFT_377229 [Apiosordaria backusii]|uniref:Uncharacterized protein n=1 Tax=Apiosordaria backusii TaxID=314023 RepID=A0AA40DM96_9PEZI|nr:hypothetical protein B0T21DRAFT_377229 [Apiosordaria backusii]